VNKTQKLMAAITASLSVGMPFSSFATHTSNVQQETKQPDDNKKTEVTIEQVSNEIHKWLSANRRSAKTVDEIASHFPQFTHGQVEQAVLNLLDDDSLRRRGSGDKDDPYRYYVPAGSEG
jgi:hypothetical protein